MTEKTIGKIEQLIWEKVIEEDKLNFTDEYQAQVREVAIKIREMFKEEIY